MIQKNVWLCMYCSHSKNSCVFFFFGGVEILGISFFYKNEHGFMSLNKKIICCQTNTPNVVNQGKNLSLF